MAGRDFDRRTLLAGAAAAGAGLLMPGAAWAQRRKAVTVAPLGGFTHGVASGEPSQTSMLFWTRFEGVGGQAVPLELEISTDPRMARARVMGQALAEPGRDWFCLDRSLAHRIGHRNPRELHADLHELRLRRRGRLALGRRPLGRRFGFDGAIAHGAHS